jgi:hypothetical protein
MAKREGTKGQTIQWPREKGHKEKQYNGQEKRDKRTNNTMAKREGTKGQRIICYSMIYGFQFSLWYLQPFLRIQI